MTTYWVNDGERWLCKKQEAKVKDEGAIMSNKGEWDCEQQRCEKEQNLTEYEGHRRCNCERVGTEKPRRMKEWRMYLDSRGCEGGVATASGSEGQGERKMKLSKGLLAYVPRVLVG